jgi:signal transduction histidine kinase
MMPEIAPLSVKITMYRIIQEALANTFRHAGTAEQFVKVWLEDESLHAEVEDSGIGFDLNADVQDGRLGLRVMRERVELLGGSFEIKTTPDEGTCIHFSLPIQEPESST